MMAFRTKTFHNNLKASFPARPINQPGVRAFVLVIDKDYMIWSIITVKMKQAYLLYHIVSNVAYKH